MCEPESLWRPSRLTCCSGSFAMPIPQVERVLDLGCGDGILGRTVMAEYPQAKGVFLDFSEPMIEAAKQKADHPPSNLHRSRPWLQALGCSPSQQPFDLVLSGLAIHHLPDERKQALYQEIFDLLKPGGMFLNLEHVAPNSEWAKQAFDDLFIDSLWSHHQKHGGTKNRDEIANEWYHRPDKTENILASVELQCQWLQRSVLSTWIVSSNYSSWRCSAGRKPK